MASSINYSYINILLLLFSFTAEYVCIGFVFGCHEAELEALLKFKLSITEDPLHKLSSWEGKDCCTWSGVRCDVITGYVNHLNITHQFSSYEYQLDFIEQQLKAQELDPSLMELRELNYLDLTGVDFQGSQVPGFIGSFQRLRYLYLCGANFDVAFPPSLINLMKLKALCYTGNDQGFLNWLPQLVNLQYLDMSGTTVTHPSDFMSAISHIPSLKDLRLYNFGLGLGNLSINTTTPLFLSNSTWISRIQHLDLSFNNIQGPLPLVFSNMTSLKYLDLSINSFSGTIPYWLRNMRNLEHLDLSSNSLSVDGESIMGFASNFKIFVYSNNALEGELSGPCLNLSKGGTSDLEELYLAGCITMGTLPYCLSDYKKLRIIDISNSNISGQIPTSIGNLSLLESLSLSDNRLGGRIPMAVGGLLSLQTLYLARNFLEGSIPDSLGLLTNLVTIDFSSNLLHGAVSDSHLGNLSRLSVLRLNNNSLSLELGSDWRAPFQLSELSISYCKIVGELPKWIESQSKLQVLDLSKTGVSGELPKWFWKITLFEMILSHNYIEGQIGNVSYKLSTLDLSYNMISGTLSGQSLCQLSQLSYLDLKSNKLSGSIPDCWVRLTSQALVSIDLSSNKLSGTIPKSIGILANLYFLNLQNNSLQGEIPDTFLSGSKLLIMDLGENLVSGSIPGFSSESHPNLKILRLRGNKITGVIPKHLCTLSSLQILDLASNRLTGNIPPCLANLGAMQTSSFAPPSPLVFPDDESTIEILKGQELPYTRNLKFLVNLDISGNGLVGSIPEGITKLSGVIGFNLSNNHLVGSIPEHIGGMESLESLDLSNNHLSGSIPIDLAALTSLSSLNLSNNQLEGQIPTGDQLQVLGDSSSYEGNPGLCGDPLPNKCISPTGNSPQQPPQREQGKEDTVETVLFYLDIMSGFAAGFWGVVGCLLLRRRYRFALFHFVGNVTDYLYVQMMARINRLRN